MDEKVEMNEWDTDIERVSLWRLTDASNKYLIPGVLFVSGDVPKFNMGKFEYSTTLLRYVSVDHSNFEVKLWSHSSGCGHSKVLTSICFEEMAHTRFK